VIYTQVQIAYDSARHQNFLTFGPTLQQPGTGCEYTVTITDSLGQATTWTTTVKVES
jgi:hypothetical protein